MLRRVGGGRPKGCSRGGSQDRRSWLPEVILKSRAKFSMKPRFAVEIFLKSKFFLESSHSKVFDLSSELPRPNFPGKNLG